MMTWLGLIFLAVGFAVVIIDPRRKPCGHEWFTELDVELGLDRPWQCTRPARHRGPHIAHGVDGDEIERLEA